MSGSRGSQLQAPWAVEGWLSPWLGREKALQMLIELRTTNLSVRAEVPKLCPLCLRKGMFLPTVLTVQSEPVLSVW